MEENKRETIIKEVPYSLLVGEDDEPVEVISPLRFNKETGEEIAVITRDEITTADDKIVVRLKPSEDGAALADAMQARQEDGGPILLDAQTLRKVAEQAIRDSRASSQALCRETQKEEQRPSVECPQPSSEKNRTT